VGPKRLAHNTPRPSTRIERPSADIATTALPGHTASPLVTLTCTINDKSSCLQLSCDTLVRTRAYTCMHKSSCNWHQLGAHDLRVGTGKWVRHNGLPRSLSTPVWALLTTLCWRLVSYGIWLSVTHMSLYVIGIALCLTRVATATLNWPVFYLMLGAVWLNLRIKMMWRVDSHLSYMNASWLEPWGWTLLWTFYLTLVGMVPVVACRVDLHAVGLLPMWMMILSRAPLMIPWFRWFISDCWVPAFAPWASCWLLVGAP
jgi:hypothetical protein